MARVPPIAGALVQRLLGGFGPWAVVARHAIPVIGVLAFGWSALACVLAVFLDSLSIFCCLGAVAAVFAMRDFAHDGQDLVDRLNVVLGGVLAFVVVVALLAFAIAVPGAFLLGITLEASHRDILEVGRSPALWKSFGVMLLFQLPRLRAFLELGNAAAKPLVQTEIGVILFRHVAIGMLCVVLGVLPDGAALVGALLLVQTVLAASELAADRLVAALGAGAGGGLGRASRGGRRRTHRGR